MPKGYWLATYKKIENKDNLGNYAIKATETIKSHGGNPLVRGGKFKPLEGDTFPRTVIWEFPSYEAAEKPKTIANSASINQLYLFIQTNEACPLNITKSTNNVIILL